MTPLPPERLRLPFAPGPFRMALGLVSVPLDDLVEIDEHYPAEMAERRHWLATNHAEVLATTPGSEAARAELLSMLAELLPRRHPDWFTREGTTLHNRLTGESWPLDAPPCDPLELSGRLVQEDLCLIDTTGATPTLVAGILCAPSRWRLLDKIGHPLAAVHGPVPLYAERLATPVDRFMAALKPGRVAQRLNWSVVDDGALFQAGGHGRLAHDPSITPDTVPDRIFLRVERQALLRLPNSGAVLFAIRVHSTPLARVLPVPGAAADLAAAIRAMPDPMADYKSVPPFRTALLACLDRHATCP